MGDQNLQMFSYNFTYPSTDLWVTQYCKEDNDKIFTAV